MEQPKESTASAVAKTASRQPEESGRTAPAVRALLEHWARAPTTPQRVAQRSRIVLLSLDGMRRGDVALRLTVSTRTVALWTKRFAEGGPEALLHDAPGRGRHAAIVPAAMRDRLREAKLLGPDDLPLSMRRAAAFLGISATSVWRALSKPFLARHRRNPKQSPDAS